MRLGRARATWRARALTGSSETHTDRLKATQGRAYFYGEPYRYAPGAFHAGWARESGISGFRNRAARKALQGRQ